MLNIKRHFSKSNESMEDVFDSVKWVKSDAIITDVNGNTVFEQREVEYPEFFSENAIKIISSKYLYGQLNSPEREHSLRQLISRVVGKIAEEGLKRKYFYDYDPPKKLSKYDSPYRCACGADSDGHGTCLNLANVPKELWPGILAKSHSNEIESGKKEYLNKVKESEDKYNEYCDNYNRDTNNQFNIFKAELTYILLHQHFAFNSPVFFNCGTPNRQNPSACFPLGIEDNLESIFEHAKTEGLIFRDGSGIGVNLSNLRAEGEQIHGGGSSSGVLSFNKIYEQVAASTKSGGRNRRAARIVILNCDHPEIEAFITCKSKEEEKARVLIKAGYSADLGGEAYSTVTFQNANHSVRITDKFMKAVEDDLDWDLINRTNGKVAKTIKARYLWGLIAKSAYETGEPGIQFDDTIQKWNTVASSGMVETSNPCSEYLGLNFTSCNLASINLIDNHKLEFLGWDNIRHITQLATIAMNILIDFGEYPTEKIATETRKYRNIGIGFTNLGALLMLEGMPYDSDKGRKFAAEIMSFITLNAYKESHELAKIFGSFDRCQVNKLNIIDITCKHGDAAKNDKLSTHLGWGNFIDSLIDHDDKGTVLLRNASVTLLAPCGCLTEDSLIQTQYGLIRLGNLGDKNGDQWQERSFKVMTDNGEKTATRFFINGQEETRTITTKKGYQITGTNKHKVKILDTNNNLVWKKFDEICENDTVVLAMNTIFGETRNIKLLPEPEVTKQNNFNFVAPKLMTPELAELIGYYMGDGCFCGNELRLAVDQKDTDVIIRMQSLIKTLFNLDSRICPQEGCVSVNVKSNALTIWWNDCDFMKIKQIGKGHIAYVPDAILETNNEKIYCSFLRGLFEADGSALTSTPTLSSIHRSFINEIRSILLSVGIPTHTHVKNAENKPNRWSKKPLLTLHILNRVYNRNFIEKIGFISKRKNDVIKTSAANISGSNDRIPMAEEQYNCVKNEMSRSEMLTYRRTNSITREQSIGLLASNVDTKDNLFTRSENLLYDKVISNENSGIKNTYDISVPDGNAYIANGFISHNTINFLMDGISSGVEPCLSLVTYKKLVGGGVIKSTNPIVAKALEKFSYNKYNEEEIANAKVHIEKYGTIEPIYNEQTSKLDPIQTEYAINSYDLPIFDCALKPANGTRTISPEGHVKMLAALQPHLSHSISKTVNLPNEATIEDIENIYMLAWKLGIKCIAVYRDGCKVNQPMSTSNSEHLLIDKFANLKSIKDLEKEADNLGLVTNNNFVHSDLPPQELTWYNTADAENSLLKEKIKQLEKEISAKKSTNRVKLPDTRESITHKCNIGGQSFYFTIGLYDDGSVGEVFINSSRHGSFASGTLDAVATFISFCLQYGAPLEDIVRKLKGINFAPNGITHNKDIPIAKSILDYLGKYLESNFLNNVEEKLPESIEKPKNITFGVPPDNFIHKTGETQQQASGQACPRCGDLLITMGRCLFCRSCGSSTGGCGG